MSSASMISWPGTVRSQGWRSAGRWSCAIGSN
jgi:hypothetical protein